MLMTGMPNGYPEFTNLVVYVSNRTSSRNLAAYPVLLVRAI